MPYYIKVHNHLFKTELHNDTIDRLLVDGLDTKSFTLSLLKQKVDEGIESCLFDNQYELVSDIAKCYSALLSQILNLNFRDQHTMKLTLIQDKNF